MLDSRDGDVKDHGSEAPGPHCRGQEIGNAVRYQKGFVGSIRQRTVQNSAAAKLAPASHAHAVASGGGTHSANKGAAASFSLCFSYSM